MQSEREGLRRHVRVGRGSRPWLRCNELQRQRVSGARHRNPGVPGRGLRHRNLREQHQEVRRHLCPDRQKQRLCRPRKLRGLRQRRRVPRLTRHVHVRPPCHASRLHGQVWDGVGRLWRHVQLWRLRPAAQRRGQLRIQYVRQLLHTGRHAPRGALQQRRPGRRSFVARAPSLWGDAVFRGSSRSELRPENEASAPRLFRRRRRSFSGIATTSVARVPISESLTRTESAPRDEIWNSAESHRLTVRSAAPRAFQFPAVWRTMARPNARPTPRLPRSKASRAVERCVR